MSNASQITKRPQFIENADGSLSLRHGFLIAGTVRENGEGYKATTRCANSYYGYSSRCFETELAACAWLVDMLAQAEARAPKNFS